MVIMDGDMTSDIIASYMTWIARMLREIELMILVGTIYIVYIDSSSALVWIELPPIFLQPCLLNDCNDAA